MELTETVSLVENEPSYYADDVANAVVKTTVLLDNEYAHVRYTKDENLIYHIFRGPKVPRDFWGRGDFGLLVLESANRSWGMSNPQITYEHGSVRPEVEIDPLDGPSQYPPHYYGGYCVLIPNIDHKPFVSEEKVGSFADALRKLLEETFTP